MSSCQIPTCDKVCIPQGKYCETHRTGKSCSVDECEKSAQGATDFASSTVVAKGVNTLTDAPKVP